MIQKMSCKMIQTIRYDKWNWKVKPKKTNLLPIFLLSFSARYGENPYIDSMIQYIYQNMSINLSFSIWNDNMAGT